MRRADDHTMALLDDVVALATELRSLFPLAVSVADEVQIFRGGRDGIAVSSSNISDPTAEAALSGVRARRQHRVKKARREIRAAVVSLRSAVSSVVLAADQ